MNCERCGRDVSHVARYRRTHDNGETWEGPYCYVTCPETKGDQLMVNHYWDGNYPSETACREYVGVMAEEIGTSEWGIVSCPRCLDRGPDTTTQDNRPETAFDNALGEILNEVRGVMNDRHTKYGPGNISKRGIPGIQVRLDDKIARIDNSTDDFADESYRDAWLDVAGYGLIALMWLDKRWPGSTT